MRLCGRRFHGSNSHPSDWTARQPFTVVRITKDPALGAATHNVPFNKANEADCYLNFILDHYHDLPPRMIFAHGHEYAWHLHVRVAVCGSKCAARTHTLDALCLWPRSACQRARVCTRAMSACGQRRSECCVWVAWLWLCTLRQLSA